MWQDLAVTIGGIILTLAMLPPVFMKGTRFPVLGSLPTAAVLTLYSWIFVTLNLPYSAVTIFLESLLWWFVVLYRRLPDVEELELPPEKKSQELYQ